MLDTAARPNGIYAIRFRNTMSGPRHKETFVRGYGFQGGNNVALNFRAPGFGAELEEGCSSIRWYRCSSSASAMLSCLVARATSWRSIRRRSMSMASRSCGLTWQWGANEKAMIPDMAVTAAEMLEAAGARNASPRRFPIASPATRFTTWASPAWERKPRRRCSTSFSRTHDVANLYVMDGAGFPSGACQNPTLTIMALAVRSCDHLLEEMKRGTV